MDQVVPNVGAPPRSEGLSEPSYLLPMKQILSLMAMALTLGAMAQATPDTVCTLNCGHPGYRSFSETYPTTGGDGETVSREYILHVPSGVWSSGRLSTPRRHLAAAVVTVPASGEQLALFAGGVAKLGSLDSPQGGSTALDTPGVQNESTEAIRTHRPSPQMWRS